MPLASRFFFDIFAGCMRRNQNKWFPTFCFNFKSNGITFHRSAIQVHNTAAIFATVCIPHIKDRQLCDYSRCTVWLVEINCNTVVVTGIFNLCFIEHPRQGSVIIVNHIFTITNKLNICSNYGSVFCLLRPQCIIRVYKSDKDSKPFNYQLAYSTRRFTSKSNMKRLGVLLPLHAGLPLAFSSPGARAWGTCRMFWGSNKHLWVLRLESTQREFFLR